MIEAKIAAGVLKVAGRKLKGGGYRNIAMEDVAALFTAVLETHYPARTPDPAPPKTPQGDPS